MGRARKGGIRFRGWDSGREHGPLKHVVVAGKSPEDSMTSRRAMIPCGGSLHCGNRISVHFEHEVPFVDTATGLSPCEGG